MSKKIFVEIEVKDFNLEELKSGDYFEYNDDVYEFKGYEYGTYPIAKRLSDGKIIELPYY